MNEQYSDPRFKDNATHGLLQPCMIKLEIHHSIIGNIRMSKSQNNQTVGIDIELYKQVPSVFQYGKICTSDIDNATQNEIENDERYQHIVKFKHFQQNVESPNNENWNYNNEDGVCIHWRLTTKCDDYKRNQCPFKHPTV